MTSQTLDPAFWNDPKRAEGIQRKIGVHKKWIEEYETLAREVDDLEGLYEFQKEGMTTDEEVDQHYLHTAEILADAEFRSTLNQTEDEMSAVLNINAGAGGTEACDWSAMLLRMYKMWAEKAGFKVNELFEQEGDAAGIKSASIEVVGPYAYGWLKGENGVHRLVRVSPFNAQGKRQPSFSSVFVYPLVEDDSIDMLAVQAPECRVLPQHVLELLSHARTNILIYHLPASQKQQQQMSSLNSKAMLAMPGAATDQQGAQVMTVG